MSLKSYLQKNLTNRAKDARSLALKFDEMLIVLDSTNTSRAKYTVELDSMWVKEGEKSTTTEYVGSLKKAIRKAEEEFKETNNRHDVQAEYKVSIHLGENTCLVPQNFYLGYKEK